MNRIESVVFAGYSEKALPFTRASWYGSGLLLIALALTAYFFFTPEKNANGNKHLKTLELVWGLLGALFTTLQISRDIYYHFRLVPKLAQAALLIEENSANTDNLEEGTRLEEETNNTL